MLYCWWVTFVEINKKGKVEDWEIGSGVLGTLCIVRVTSEYQWITDF